MPLIFVLSLQMTVNMKRLVFWLICAMRGWYPALATNGSAFISSYARAGTHGVNQSPRMPNVVKVRREVVEDLALLDFIPLRLRRRNR